MRFSLALLGLAGVLLLPAAARAQDVTPKDTVGPDTVVFTPERGTVIFTHARHAKAAECTSCHHESKPEHPLTSARQACKDCHVTEPVAPMKTSRKLAFHNTVEKQGTCYTCHVKEAANGKTVPSACADCHKRDATQ